MQPKENAQAAIAKPRRRPGRPRADEPQGEGLREAVIEAAAQVYGSHGYREASVELIATAAGISRPLFYRLFKDRREVIDIVVARANDNLRARVVVAIQPYTRLVPMFSAAIDAYFSWCGAYAQIAGSIYRELNDPEAPAGAHRTRILLEMHQLFSDKAQQRGGQMLPPMMLGALLCTIEHVGSHCFWPQLVTTEEMARNRAIIQRIVLATVASADEQQHVPSLESIMAT